MKTYMGKFVPKKPNKPILYWAAYQNNVLINTNNSIPLLRHSCKGLTNVIFKAIR